MRLDRFLTQAALLTRSQAKLVLRQGRVTFNGTKTKSASAKVGETDVVCLDKTPLSLPSLRYLMLHKPVGYVCANEDAEHQTVFDLLPSEVAESPLGKVHCAGRLDLDTTGFVLITDDGQWSHRVTSPNRTCQKRYQVTLAEPVEDTAAAIAAFEEGVQLKSEDKPALPAQLTFSSPTEATLYITEGRYHQVKRMFAATGNKVVKLHRDKIGDIELDTELAEGEYRDLSEAEVAAFMPEPTNVS